MKHGDRVRRDILETACRLIGAAGLEACTFKRVGEALDMSPNAILYHFKSREGLIRAAAFHAIKQDDAKCLGQLVAARHPSVATMQPAQRALYLAALA